MPTQFTRTAHKTAIRFVVLLLLIAIAFLPLVLPTPARAAPTAFYYSILVTTTTDEYDATANSTCSLREAIKSQNDNVNFGGCARGLVLSSGTDTIVLPSGTYTLTLSGSGEELDATGDLDIRASVIISTTGAVTATVTGGASWGDRIFHVLTGTVTIKHMAIREGHDSSVAGGGGVRIESGASLIMNDSEVADSTAIGVSGGGILNRGTATLTNVTFYSNTAGDGGGIYNEFGTATLTNVTLSGNSTTGYGGGIFNFGTATLTNVTLSGNFVINCGSNCYGGGIFNSGTATFTNVTLSGNFVINCGSNCYGGGIYNDGMVMLTNVTLSGNSATTGGGIFNFGTATLTNVTLSGNSVAGAFNFGGGIFNSGTATLTNVTLSGNSAVSGGGIYQESGTVTLTNTIVANSPSGGNCSGISGGSSNLSSDNTCGFGASRINMNVMLGPLANNGGPTLTHMLLPGSPAINFGINTGCPSTDQRGYPRPQPLGGVCDVGAVERQSSEGILFLFLPLILR